MARNSTPKARNKADDEALADVSERVDKTLKRQAGDSLLGSSMAGRFLKRLPGGRFAESQLEELESRVFKRLKTRLDSVGERQSMSVLAVSVSAESLSGQGMPGDLLRQLLESSEQLCTKQQAELEYFTRVVQELVPDEARLLAALSDDVVYPVIDVLVAGKLSLVSRPLVEMVSNVGKAAGVRAPELTPSYVRHLRRLGLVDIVPGQTADLQQYQLLETDSEVRSAMQAAHAHGQRARILRRSVKLSSVGARLWTACRLSGD